MIYTLQQIFHSGKFKLGFAIFTSLLAFIFIYPIFIPEAPLAILGQGTFFPPGIYVNVYDSLDTSKYIINQEGAAKRRIANKLSEDDRVAIKEYLVAAGVDESRIDITNTDELLQQWKATFDPKRSIKGFTNAKRNYYIRLNTALQSLYSTGPAIIAVNDPETNTLLESKKVTVTEYVNVNEVPNVRIFPLGTDNFGRDMLTELVAATKTSLQIGFIAGLIATLIGLTLGLLAGYIGGFVDDIINFISNLFIVIPPFVLLVLISFSIGQEQRGASTVAAVIGFTSWVWTARAVRSQVISLRNRDHVNLSKLSGHSIPHIILTDILPYIASYVIMAMILQISSGILAEASLSILGLGPKTTEVPTLGLMMNWAMIYQAQLQGNWWAYFPVLAVIALIAFSMNLMNTGLDQVFNPSLRD